ncbi:flippase [bacterium]|nr:flippase [bacterium]
MINKTNVKNFFFLSFSEGVSGLLFFIALTYAARVLGPDPYGRIMVARSVMLYFLMLVNAGLDIYGIREGSRDIHRIESLLGKIIPLRLLLSAITFVLLALLLQVFPDDQETRRLVMVYSGMIILTALSIEWYFQCTERMGLPAIGRLLCEAVFIIVVFLAVKSREQLLWIPVARVLGMFIQQLFYWMFSFREFGLIRFQCNRAEWISILKKSLPMGFGIIMVQIYYYLDSLMLGILSDYSQAGLYSAVYRLLVAAIIITSMLNKALYPRLSTLFKTSLEEMTALMNDGLRYLAIVACLIVFHGFILASWCIPLLYKDMYVPAIPVFKIVIFNLMFVVINGLLAHGILAADREKKYMAAVTLGAVINLIFNMLLIPAFNMYGAASATILSEMAVLIYFFRIYRTIGIAVDWKRIAGIYGIALAVSVVVYIAVFRYSLIGAIAVFNVLYLTILYHTGLLPKEKVAEMLAHVKGVRQRRSRG